MDHVFSHILVIKIFFTGTDWAVWKLRIFYHIFKPVDASGLKIWLSSLKIAYFYHIFKPVDTIGLKFFYSTVMKIEWRWNSFHFSCARRKNQTQKYKTDNHFLSDTNSIRFFNIKIYWFINYLSSFIKILERPWVLK